MPGIKGKTGGMSQPRTVQIISHGAHRMTPGRTGTPLRLKTSTLGGMAMARMAMVLISMLFARRAKVRAKIDLSMGKVVSKIKKVHLTMGSPTSREEAARAQVPKVGASMATKVGKVGDSMAIALTAEKVDTGQGIAHFRKCAISVAPPITSAPPALRTPTKEREKVKVDCGIWNRVTSKAMNSKQVRPLSSSPPNTSRSPSTA